MRSELLITLQIILTGLEIVAIVLGSEILREVVKNTSITKRNSVKLDEIKNDSQQFK